MCTQSNIGESVILVKSQSEPGAMGDALDINEIMKTSNGGAMSVEITDCIFRVCSTICLFYDFCLHCLSSTHYCASWIHKQNTLKFGTISNIGGTLTVYKTLFELNTAKVNNYVSGAFFGSHATLF